MNKHKKPIPLQSYIEVEDLCKCGCCLSKSFRELYREKEYVYSLKCAIKALNSGDVDIFFFFLLRTLWDLEEEEKLDIPSPVPSQRERADRYYKMLRAYEGKEEATE